MENRWKVKDNTRTNKDADAIIQDILRHRGVEDLEEYFSPTEKSFYNPYEMQDMEQAVNRIKEAVEQKENITLFGDYDVDGISATSILILYFREIGYPVQYYIPNRKKEGYGLNKEAIKKIAQDGTKLIITVDCGIGALEETTYGKELGLDFIITDHHQCREELPSVCAVINPHRNDCRYPFEHLCGAGIAFKLVQALKSCHATELLSYMEIAAIATIADIVELTGENRALVKIGLQSINEKTYNLGLSALATIAGVAQQQINSYHVGYVLAPRINSSGRIGEPQKGVELLVSEDKQTAYSHAALLNELNQERQKIEEEIVRQAMKMIEDEEENKNRDVLVVYQKGWHEGVIGIVASRITEKYYKPSFVISFDENGIGKGSGRSIPGFHLFQAMNEIEDCMIGFGGHAQAAGMSVSQEKITEFIIRINQVATNKLSKEDKKRQLKAECILEPSDVTQTLCNKIRRMEPFGMKNAKPLFILQNVNLQYPKKIGKMQAHLSAFLDNKRLVGFGMAELVDEYVSVNERELDVLVTIEENVYRENAELQINCKDYKWVKRAFGLFEARDFCHRISEDGKVSVFDKKRYERWNETNFCDKNLYLTCAPGAYNRLITEQKYQENGESKVKFCVNIEKMDIKGYNNIIICDSLSKRAVSSLETRGNVNFFEWEISYNDLELEKIVSFDREKVISFLKVLRKNRKVILSETRLRSMQAEKLLKTVLQLEIFQKHGILSLVYGQNKIYVDYRMEKEENMQACLQELQNIAFRFQN